MMARNAAILLLLVVAMILIRVGVEPYGVPAGLVYGLGVYLVAYVYAQVTR